VIGAAGGDGAARRARRCRGSRGRDGRLAGRGGCRGGRLGLDHRRRRLGRLLGGGCRRLLLRLRLGLALGDLRRLFGLLVSNEALALGLAPHAVALRLLDARGMRLDPDAELGAEVEGLLVGEPERFRELVDSDLACQRA